MYLESICRAEIDCHLLHVFQVSQGSGYFQPQLDSNDIVDVRYMERTRSLEIRARGTGTARLGLIDLCLPSRPALIAITVVGVQTISVDVTDRLQKGKRALCTVKITDTTGNPIEVKFRLDVQMKKNALKFAPSITLSFNVPESMSEPGCGPKLLFLFRSAVGSVVAGVTSRSGTWLTVCRRGDALRQGLRSRPRDPESRGIPVCRPRAVAWRRLAVLRHWPQVIPSSQRNA